MELGLAENESAVQKLRESLNIELEAILGRECALNRFARSASESPPAARARNDAAPSTSVAVIRTPFNSANKNDAISATRLLPS